MQTFDDCSLMLQLHFFPIFTHTAEVLTNIGQNRQT